MKMKLKTKGIIKKVALALAGVAALTAVGFGIKAIVDYTKNDLKKITLAFEVGNLGADGVFVDDKSTLYTKNAFKCDGLQVKLDFDNEINYQIFYYDDLDKFMSATEILSEGYSEPTLGVYARIVIIPTNDEDGKISLTERITYPNQMTIKVLKDQTQNTFVLGGRTLVTVSNPMDLVFGYGAYDSISDTWELSNSSTAITSFQLLKVSNKTIKCVPVTDTHIAYVNMVVFEFGLKNDKLNLIEKISLNSSADGVNSVKLNKDTKYVLIECSVKSSEGTFIAFDEKSLKEVNSYFSVN